MADGDEAREVGLERKAGDFEEEPKAAGIVPGLWIFGAGSAGFRFGLTGIIL